MKHYILFAFLFFNFFSFSQIDAVKIGSAKKAYENGEYQIAVNSLNEVSSVGQKNKMYFYYKGLSFYKLNRFDSAEVYLKKYLINDVNNSTVTDALIDIEYQKRKLEKLEVDKKARENLTGEWEEIKKVGDDHQYEERNLYEIIQSGNLITLKKWGETITFQGEIKGNKIVGKKYDVKFDHTVFKDSKGETCWLCVNNNFETEAYIEISSGFSYLFLYIKDVSRKIEYNNSVAENCCKIYSNGDFRFNSRIDRKK